MSVDYAEPQQLKDFKIDVLPVNSNTPIVTKQPGSNIFTPTTPGDIVKYNSRNSDLGRPSNLPPIQQNLRNDGQYRTIDLIPRSRNDGSIPSYTVPSRRTSDQLQTIRNNGTNTLTAGQNFARDQAIAEAAYHSGFFLDGLFDGIQNKNFPNENLRMKRTPLEDLAYAAGNKAGNEARNIVKDAKDALKKSRDEIWKNRPSFEIPQLKLPDFQLPELKFTELPEFKFPEISFPQPKPIPPPKPAPPLPKLTLRERLKDIDVSPCGRVYIVVAYASRVTGYREIVDDDGWQGTQNIFVQSSLSSVADLYRKYIPELADKSDYQIAGYGADGYGSNPTIKNDEGIFNTGTWGYIRFNEDGYSLNPPFGRLNYPHQQAVMLFGEATKATGLNTLINYFENSPLIPEIIYLNAENPGVCPLTKEPKPEPPPPLPPPEKDCCRMSCCPKPTQIDYRLIKKLMAETIKEQSFSVDVPIINCEFNETTNLWEPKIEYVTLDFFATNKLQAEQMAVIHVEQAKQTADLCLDRNKIIEEPIASVPLSFQIRHEGRTPQMVIQCAEMTKGNDGQWKYGSAKYPITVPHWKGGENDKPRLPAYRKGNYEGIYVLADNSKITVNAANQAECTKIMNAIKPWVPKELLDGGYFKGGTINAKIKNTLVQPMYGRYFSEGQRNTKPDWRVDFL